MAKGGGVGPHDIRGLAAADIEPRLGMARAEGQARSQDIVSLLDARKKEERALKQSMELNFIKRQDRRVVNLTLTFTAKSAERVEE